MLFPSKYCKPVLLSIVDAAASGWNAVCNPGARPGSGAMDCTGGDTAGITNTVFGTSAEYQMNSGGSSRLINPGDVSRGL